MGGFNHITNTDKNMGINSVKEGHFDLSPNNIKDVTVYRTRA